MNKTDIKFAPGKLVKSMLSGMIVMCVDTSRDGGNDFAGVVIYQGESSDYPVGYYSKDWTKDKFISYCEPITITPPKTLELTLEDIASKFGVDVDVIKIVKN